jgi:hypothetical protein
MKLKTGLAIVALASSVLYTSCGKDPVNPTEENVVSTAPAVNKCDFSPYSVGSTFTSEVGVKDILSGKWSYSEAKSSVTAYKDFNGKKWSTGTGFLSDVAANQTQTKESYMRCDDKGAYLYVKGAGLNGQDIESPYLQYPLTKNKTWTSTPIINSVDGLTEKFFYHYTVVNTGLSKKIKNTTFTNVIEIDEKALDIITFDGDTDTIQVNVKRFFDKTAGHIQTLAFYQDPFTGKMDTAFVQNILSYYIK